MQVVAITGASGFIGRHLTRALLTRPGVQVRALYRQPERHAAKSGDNLEVVKGSLDDPLALERLLRPGCAVVNCAYDSDAPPQRNLAAADTLAAACARAGIGRLVHCSTAVVAGRVTTDIVDETTPCLPYDEYERTKLAVEDRLRSQSRATFDLLILRPTAVFGPHGRNLLSMVARLTTAPRALNYALSALNDSRAMNLVSIENVIAAILFLLDKPVEARQQLFIVSDDEAPENNYRDVERHLMRELGLSDYAIAPIAVPSRFLSVLLRLRRRSQVNPKVRYACEKLLAAGYRKPVSFVEALSKYARWHASRP